MSFHRSFNRQLDASLASEPFCARPKRVVGEGGFTLLELMMVVTITAVCMAVAVAVNPTFVRGAKADSGVAQALDVLRTAREMAISQRRNIRVLFTGTNTIQTIREEVDAAGTVTGTTVLRTVNLENRMRFMLVAGQPDTPDQFGRSAPASFSSALRRFSTEGTFIDSTGDPMNGTLFLAVPDDPNSARAITFFGPTALLRAWKWNGKQWVE
jgi:prepilin-type N-terminal cleavage/methylation domain-containing protein